MRKILKLGSILFLAMLVHMAGAQSLTVTPTVVANGSTTTITATCLGATTGANAVCQWTSGTPGSPAFSAISGGSGSGCGQSISAQVVTSATTATLTLVAGTCNNKLGITAPPTAGPTSPILAIVQVQPTFAQDPLVPFLVNGTTTTFGLIGIGSSWLTSSPSFTLSGCGTASKTGQTILTNTTATITINAGGTDCTITLTDPSSTLTIALPVHTPAHWYVRPGGGTRFSSNETSGQCDGAADVDYPGTGTNQHCAFNDVPLMWQDGSHNTGFNFPAYGWLPKGGDTITIRGAIADSVSYRIGWPNASNCGTDPNVRGICGDNNDSGAPSIPSGVAGDHTVIEGGNFASCAAQTARTQLHGGFQSNWVIALGVPLSSVSNPTTPTASNYVDLACLDITDFADNVTNTGDFTKQGVQISHEASNVTLTNVRIHGVAFDGVHGTTGGNLTFTSVDIVGNHDAGWNADAGDGFTGWGVLTMTGGSIQWSGCYELVNPLTSGFINPYQGCNDDVSGGYGDGFGTTTVNSPSPGWQVTFNNTQAFYNTQDGLDSLHIGGVGSSITESNTLAYGNMGNQLKGGGSIPNLFNNVVNGNCEAMSTAITGTPTGYNSALSDFCRAGDTAIVVEVTPTSGGTFENNTLFTRGDVGVEIEPANVTQGATWTGTETLAFRNNVFVGFNGGGGFPSQTLSILGDPPFALTNGGSVWTNNATFNGGITAPQSGESNALTSNPGLVDMTYHTSGFGNMAPASGSSAVVGAGTTPAPSTDFNGNAQTSPPTMGALVYVTFTGRTIIVSSTGLNLRGIQIR